MTRNLELRPAQKKALEFILQSHSKIVGLEAPTGFGKSIVTISLAKHYAQKGKKVIISSFTKQLQNQFLKEIDKNFPELKEITTVVKGKGNFICLDKLETEPTLKQMYEEKNYIPKVLRDKIAVDEYCSPDYRKVCPFRNKCEYLNMVQEAQNAQILILNHFLLPAYADKADVIIIDEVHLLDQALCSVKELNLDFLKNYVPEELIQLRDFKLIYRHLYEEIQKILHSDADVRKIQKIQTLMIKTERVEKEVMNTEVKALNGKIEYLSKNTLTFENNEKVIYLSGTFPETFIAFPPPEDFIKIHGKRYDNIVVEIEGADYREPEYYAKVQKAVEELLVKHGRVMILCTSRAQIEELKKRINGIKTTNDTAPWKLVEKFKNREVNVIAGTDVLWTGVDIPGEKGIVMMKIPFEPPDRVKLFPQAEAVLIERAKTKFRQGLGRMKRTDGCKGTIKIMDWRLTDEKFSDFMCILEDLERHGAQIEDKTNGFRYEFKEADENFGLTDNDLDGIPPELREIIAGG